MGKNRSNATRRYCRGDVDDLTSKFVYRICSRFGKDSKLAARAKALVLRGSWSSLVRLPFEPQGYTTPREFAVDYLISEFVSKLPPDVTGVSPDSLRDAAMEKFMECEEHCRDTNARWSHPESRSFRVKHGRSVYEVYHLARQKIESVLGPLDMREVASMFGFGPGATTRLTRAQSDLYHKFGHKPDTTHHNLVLSDCIIQSVNSWAVSSRGGATPGSNYDHLNVVVGNKVTTVPKNSKTDRCIAIEPDMNSFVQKGYGGVIRRRLRRVGINLDDQSLNQRLAKEGSVDGSLSTIDLSSASDTVSSRIVELLLPEEWYRALNSARSHFGVLASGDVIRYQKFSSMGNGFTFELETLIFWALTQACIQYLRLKDRRCGVYGDDIIAPTACSDLLLNVLATFGFTPNVKKTFITGPFRESCGKHYFRGRDVTPFYLRKKMDHIQPVFVSVNNLRRWLNRLDDGAIRPDNWQLYKRISKDVPKKFRHFRGPDGYGDSYLIGNFEEALPTRAKRGWEGWRVESFNLLSVKPPKDGKYRRVDGEALIPKSLYRAEKGSLSGEKVLPSAGGR